MNSKHLSIKDFSGICFKLLRKEKPIMFIILMYAVVASGFNLILPLSIQYIGSQIIANSSIFPIITIIICLFVSLIFYATLKLIQVFAFSYLEKRFFIFGVALIALNSNTTNISPHNINNATQSYTEISNIIKYINEFLFSTSLLIQQIMIGLILTAFYHISFLVFNVLLLLIIFTIFKIYFLPSIVLHKKELDVKYVIGGVLHDQNYENKITKIDHLLLKYYDRKNRYFRIIFQQNIAFFLLYILANTVFLAMSSILTLNGHLTIPQFLASELIFSLIFMNLDGFAKNLKNIYELLNSSHKLNAIIDIAHKKTDYNFEQFAVFEKIKMPKFYKMLLKIILVFFVLVGIGMVFIPWWQTSRGNGKVIAYNQEDRVQDITSLVSGRISHWYVHDGQRVYKGDKIAEIVDNDPELINKLNEEIYSVKAQYSNAQMSTKTAEINYHRQEGLYNQGLSARKEFEKAKIEYQKLLGYENEIKAKLIQTDVKLARQKAQVIIAPKDGFVLQSKAKAGASYVYAGETIATFVPIIDKPAVEIFVNPYDMPLIHIGAKARVQIEGWPALRIPGWPATSLGTFGARVAIIDQAISANGKFRLILVPDTMDVPWPDMKYIKQGTNIRGWVSMNRVSVGYELWRQINSFPIEPNETLLSQKHEK